MGEISSGTRGVLEREKRLLRKREIAGD